MRRALLVLMLVVPACGSSPVQGRSVTEQGTTLTYLAAPVDYSGEDDFNWVNDSMGVIVQFAGTALTSGSVQVTMLDVNGDRVLPAVFDDGGSAMDSGGVAGQWQVEVVYQNATGVVKMVANQD